MLEKYAMIHVIMKDLKGKYGTEFQDSLRPILRKYYKRVENYTYNMPDAAYGGDDKNDGWVKELKRFYQVYSPVAIKGNDTFVGDLNKKFEKDFRILLEHIYVNNSWGGELEEFVFIYNTKTKDLPAETKLNCDQITANLQKKYNKKFKASLVDLNYINEKLNKLDKETLMEIMNETSNLGAFAILDKIIPEAILEILEKMNANVYEYEMEYSDDFTIIPLTEKINKNSLIKNKKKIEQLQKKINLVEKIKSDVIDQDMELVEKFEALKVLIIKKYKALKTDYTGDVLFDKLIGELVKIIAREGFLLPIVSLLVVFFFEKCDIFEKN